MYLMVNYKRYCRGNAEDVFLQPLHFASYVSYVVGVHSVAYAFPKVHLVTTAVDPEINDQFYILPGIGE